MSRKLGKTTFINKKKDIEDGCLYGMEYFCDGTPNKSVFDTDIRKPICPIYQDCAIKSKKVFETSKGGEQG